MHRSASWYGSAGVSSTALLLLLGALPACASSEVSEPERMAAPELLQLDGNYNGSLTIMGQQLFGSLSIAQDGERLDLTFRFPEVGLQASGDGAVSDEGFTGKVSYAVTCPGEATFDAVKDREDGTLSGTVSTSDCEGTNSGTFRFSPRN
jgi:hypothetical protein